MQKKSFSWGMIILLFILFFPVGIWMLVRKMTDEKYNYLKNGSSLKTFGWMLIVFGIIYFFISLAESVVIEDGSSADGSITIMLIFFFGSGFFMIFKGGKLKARGIKFNRYVSIVNNINYTSIDSIAAAYPTAYETAASDLQQMLDAGYFLNSYIDLNRKELVMPSSRTSNSETVIDVQNNDSMSASPRTVQCPNCGASNTVMPGVAGECEYCSSPL